MRVMHEREKEREREEDACAQKKRREEQREKEREDKDVRCFLSSYAPSEMSALPLFFQKTMSEGPAGGTEGVVLPTCYFWKETLPGAVRWAIDRKI